MKTITLNGEKKNPDVNGNVNIDIPKVEVDESLDQESTNPVQNKAIVARLNELEASALKSVDVEPNDDETAVHLSLIHIFLLLHQRRILLLEDTEREAEEHLQGRDDTGVQHPR